MSQQTQPNDMELAALIASKVCHDVINPVGAINNGLEMLDEEEDPESREYALDMIRNVTSQATVRLKFARFAYGAAGSAGDSIDLRMAEEICREYVVKGGKHTLVWQGPAGYMAKDKVKLLLNLVAGAITALPRGGDIQLDIAGSLENPSFQLRCQGPGARPPQYLADYVNGGQPPALDALSIQAYYTWRLAASSSMRLEITKEGADIVLAAKPLL
jgi:histidine phosphotransferase ChpT